MQPPNAACASAARSPVSRARSRVSSGSSIRRSRSASANSRKAWRRASVSRWTASRCRACWFSVCSRRQVVSHSSRWASTLAAGLLTAILRAGSQLPGEPGPATRRVGRPVQSAAPDISGFRRAFGLLGLGCRASSSAAAIFCWRAVIASVIGPYRNRFSNHTSSRKLTIWATTVNQSICMATGRRRR